jgi:nicotinate-nucleotide pyrophosphorylase (carboxylating)
MSPAPPIAPPRHIVAEAVARALAEDLGRRGDITSDAVIEPGAAGRWEIAARARGVIAGLDCARETFAALDPAISFDPSCDDGWHVEPGQTVACLAGPVRAVLAGERTALNFLGHLSGIASLTARYVALTSGTKAHIVCTRKTTPGLRALEKYAVAAGGGRNHRFGLDDAVLIKDNHVAAAGGVSRAVAAARAHVGHMTRIEVEVDSIAGLEEALAAGAGIVLLDNMSIAELDEAVRVTDGRAVLEASGGVSEQTCAAIAATGVDLISVGRLTHSAPALDLGLDAVG